MRLGKSLWLQAPLCVPKSPANTATVTYAGDRDQLDVLHIFAKGGQAEACNQVGQLGIDRLRLGLRRCPALSA